MDARAAAGPETVRPPEIFDKGGATPAIWQHTHHIPQTFGLMA
jgi:hypothetical protein